jgi:hypothetical protein
MKRIYITDEAYNALVGYCLLKNKTWRGMAFEASSLLLEAISQKTGIPMTQKANIPTVQQPSGPVAQEANRPVSQQSSGPTAQKDNIPESQWTNRPIDQKAEAPSRKRQAKKTIYDRWIVKYAGIIRGIKNMKAMEKEAKEAKFLFYPVGKDSAVVIDRYWVNKAIELGNHPQLKVSLGDAEEIARQVVEGGKRDDELTLRERVALALYTLNRDGSAIYASNGWTLTIPDLALEEKPKAQEKGAGEKKTEQKREAPSKVEEKPKEEDACKDKAVPETRDIEFVRVDGVVGQIAYRGCVEKRGYHLYMAAPEVGVVVNPQYESALLDKVKKGEVQYSREEVEKALESYLKNRAKALTSEDKERILLRLLLQEVKVTYADGKWRVVEKPATGTMLDKLAGQGV